MRLIALLGLASCGRLGFATIADARGEDASATADACATFGAWSAPQLVPGPIESLTDDSWFPTPTVGATELFFHSYRGPEPTSQLWVGTRASPSDEWTTPTEFPELVDSTVNYYDPTLTEDGLIMLYSVGPTGANPHIFESTRASIGATWSPRAAVASLSSSTADTDTWLSADGLRVVLSSSRAPSVGGLDLFEATRPDTSSDWSALVPLTELDSPENDDAPTLSADGLEVLFSSLRPGGPGGQDVYTARRPALDQPFSTPVLVPQLSSPLDDYGLRLQHDGTVLFYNYDTKTAGGGNAEFWIATRSCQ